jgi:hypothetical protein
VQRVDGPSKATIEGRGEWTHCQSSSWNEFNPPGRSFAFIARSLDIGSFGNSCTYRLAIASSGVERLPRRIASEASDVIAWPTLSSVGRSRGCYGRGVHADNLAFRRDHVGDEKTDIA